MVLPLILDTDIGMDVDDAIALCFTARDPSFDLRAVTTVNGDTQKRARVARALLRLCGRDDVPIGAGAAAPIDGREHALMPVDHVDTDEVQGIETETHPSAHDVLVAALESATVDEPVTICTIGPVTNIASLLVTRPDLLDRVARIQMMGGCLRPWQANGVEGSLFEFNVGCDPLATSVLFSLPLPVGVVPIDVTIGAFLDEDDRSAIAAAGRLGAVLDVLMNNFLEFLRGFMPEAQHNVFLHDPLTVATLAYPDIAAFEPARVSAFGTPGACRMVESPHGRLVDACRSVDNRAIANLIVHTLTY